MNPTLFANLKRWVERAKAEGFAYVIIATDDFSMEDYPKKVSESDDFFVIMSRVSPDRIKEVYDLNIDLDYQLHEPRAYHPPADRNL